jgi:Fungal Zn(2)-Cys(6) binuclear cluster domain./Fungal specific transcription factor domain.
MRLIMSSPRPSKRQRIYRACDQCRRRKSKCDGEQPVCSICQSANRSCTYQKGGGRRGLPSGYVRSLEIVLGLISQYVPNSEATTHSVLRDYRREGNFLTSDVAEQSVKIWRKSKLSQEVSQLLNTGSEDLAFTDSEWELMKTQDHESIDNHGGPPLISRPNEVTSRYDVPVRSCESQENLPEWSIPDDTPDLLDSYFTYTHCWFPILERRELLRAMHISPSRSTFGPVANQILLWSVIVYSCAMKGIHYPGLPTHAAIQLYTQRPLVSHITKLELDHIQSTLIIALTHISMGNIKQAWLLLGQAARMLVILPSNLRKGRFNHTFNGCVFLDNIVSTLLNKTPCLSAEEQIPTRTCGGR